MKTQLKKIKIVVLLTVCITMSCKKENEVAELPYYQFNQEEKAWLFLKQGDSLVFEDNKNEKIVYQVKEVLNLKCEGGTTWRDLPNTITYYHSVYQVKCERRTNNDVYYWDFTAHKTIPLNADIMNPPATEGRFSFYWSWSEWNGRNNKTSVYYTDQPYPNETISIGTKVFTNVIVHNSGNYTPNQNISNNTTPIAIIYYDKYIGPLKFYDILGNEWIRKL
jgi:hypothetical protein